jgi:hypothetical protein
MRGNKNCTHNFGGQLEVEECGKVILNNVQEEGKLG